MTRKLQPCGTRASRRRHQARNETCTTCQPITPRPRDYQCGTRAVYSRGCRCEPCVQAERDYRENRKTITTTQARNNLPTPDLIAEIEQLLRFGEGEHRILQATNYTTHPHRLHDRLNKAGRQDLTGRIFRHQDEMSWAA